MSPKSQINFNFLAISTQVMIMIPLLKSVPGHVINRRQDALSRKKKKKKRRQDVKGGSGLWLLEGGCSSRTYPFPETVGRGGVCLVARGLSPQGTGGRWGRKLDMNQQQGLMLALEPRLSNPA